MFVLTVSRRRFTQRGCGSCVADIVQSKKGRVHFNFVPLGASAQACGTMLDTDLFRLVSSSALQGLLDKIIGPKTLVLDPTLAGPLGLVTEVGLLKVDSPISLLIQCESELIPLRIDAESWSEQDVLARAGSALPGGAQHRLPLSTRNEMDQAHRRSVSTLPDSTRRRRNNDALSFRQIKSSLLPLRPPTSISYWSYHELRQSVRTSCPNWAYWVRSIFRNFNSVSSRSNTIYSHSNRRTCGRSSLSSVCRCAETWEEMLSFGCEIRKAIILRFMIWARRS